MIDRMTPEEFEARGAARRELRQPSPVPLSAWEIVGYAAVLLCVVVALVWWMP